MRQFKRTAISGAVAQALLLGAGAVHAQSTTEPASLGTVTVTGQRAALQSAQKLKQNAEEIVDSVVAEEAGKLPDKSITEVLQRVVGVTMDRNRSRGDPEHFSVEGSGISVRGLSWGSSTLNGRETFSAGWPGRELSWGDVPPELMSGVDVYKNPSSELIEGAISGLVNLRTHLPFDFKGTKSFVTLQNNYTEVSGKSSPGISAMYTTQWEDQNGRWGVLFDVAHNRSSYQNETLQLGAYYPRKDLIPGQTAWVPAGAAWRTNTGDTERSGLYGAFQWKNNDMESALTYFGSASHQVETETATFLDMSGNYGASPYTMQIADGVYDERGVFQSGRLTMPGSKGANQFLAGGIPFNANSGYSDRTSQTHELAWNFKWKIDDRWSVQNDLQWVHSKFKSFGTMIALATFVPSMQVDASGTGPVRIGFDQNARDFLANPGNYFWDHIMPSKSKADADLYAWKADAKLRFEDPVLRDFRFGTRLTYRTAERFEASGDSWKSIAEPWGVKSNVTPGQVPGTNDPQNWQRGNFSYMSDPRYVAPTELFNYGDFYRGRVGTLPNVVFPTQALVRDYPNAYHQLIRDFRYQQCLDKARADGQPLENCRLADFALNPLVYDGNPEKTSTQSEWTQAIYGTLRFAFDDWKFPLEGSVGVRVVRTKAVAHGYEIFDPQYGENTPPDLPRFDAVARPLNVEHTFKKVLPSVNLRLELSKNLQGRLALSQGMHRPGFDKLNEYVVLKQNVDTTNNTVSYTGENKGNAKLKPTMANNYDLALEWYPREGQSLTGTVFHKDVKDIIMNTIYTRTYNSSGGNPQIFSITGPNNVAKAKVSGFEIAGMTYLDKLSFLEGKLPDWAKGFGVSANYTYIDAKQTLYKQYDSPYCASGTALTNASLRVYGCDTNGLPFNDLPLPYMSKNAANFTLMYDSGPLSARLAYSWRSRFLQSVDANGTRGSDATSADPARVDSQGNAPTDVGWGLPTWQEALGQWDAGVQYKFTDAFSMAFNVTNLTDVTIRQTQQQHVGNMGRAWFYPGRSYQLTARYEF